MNLLKKTAIRIGLSFLFLTNFNLHAQTCNWTSIFYDSYEYTTVIPYIIPGMTIHNTPQTFAGCIRTGNRGMYLNIIDGQIGLIYAQPFTSICVGQQYRISFSTRDAFVSTNNLTFNIKDANGLILSTQNVINNSVWNDVTMPAFTANTASITFEIITNTVGGNGNDVGFDDLRLWQCQPVPQNFTFNACSNNVSFDGYAQIATANLSALGVWTGPSPLGNGHLGSYAETVNTNGLYTYTIDGAAGCADSVANLTIQVNGTPAITPQADIAACQSYTLPAITGTNLAGNERYYTQPNGGGSMLPVGSTITNSQLIYIYGGQAGCSDEESFQISIQTPLLAGTDNQANYCGPGVNLNLNTILSSNASLGGTWTETSPQPSGVFNAATGVLSSSLLTGAGNYTFTYTTAANGSCAGDVANFTINFGDFLQVNIGPDTTLCPQQTITLNASLSGPFDTYQWNNNSTNPIRFITSPGTYSVKAGTLGDNQIVNGDFEQGNTGFTTSYTLGGGGAWGLVSNPGTYAITTSPNLAHTNFAVCQDHTPAPGTQMLVVNGSGNPGSTVWCQTVPVQSYTDYQFGAWVANALNETNVAQLQFSINGATLGNMFTTSTTSCNWQQFFQVWNSAGSNSANICVVNQNTSNGGNDFLIDDITFKPICFSYDTVVVTFAQNPVVNLGADINACAGTEIVLDAQNPGSTFAWNDGSTAQTFSVTTAGNYQVTVTNANFCSKTDQISVAFETPKSAGNDTSATWCATINSIDLNNLLSSTATANGTWSDLSGTLSTTLTTSGNLTVSTLDGTHQAQYVVTGVYCPNDTSIVQFTVNQQPIATTFTSLNLCNTVGETQELMPFVAGVTETLGSYWVETSNVLSNQFNATDATLDVSNLSAGTYIFNHVLTASAPCLFDTTQVQITIVENPIIQFSSDVERGCFPLEVEFLNESVTAFNSTIEWTLGDGTVYNNTSNFEHLFNSVDCFDVTLRITAEGLCTSEATVTDMICVDPLPIAAFNANPQQVFSVEPQVSFDNQSTLNAQNQWSFDDGTFSSVENPIHDFPLGEVGNFAVQLIVTSDAGCKDTAMRIIYVKDQLLFYCPNTFTPDGDEFNNTFKPVMESGFDAYSFVMKIYNRWGEEIFVSNDILTGWDGTYGGKMVMNDTYVWVVEFKSDNDDNKFRYEGHVNLIR